MEAGNDDRMIEQQPDRPTMELFLPFRCFCMRRHVRVFLESIISFLYSLIIMFSLWM